MNLRRYLTAPPAEPARAAPERCELCAAPIPAAHDHLVDVTGRSLPCACQACYLLFVPTAGDGAGAGARDGSGRRGARGRRYAAVPREYVALPGFALSEADWAALDVPVRLVFVFVNSVLGHPVALYPSPAGAAESQLPPRVWAELLARHPYTAALPADVMALLVHGGPDGPECHAVPIDACYRLVGLVRTLWRGFDGGQEARAAIDGFLAEVRSRAVPAPEPLAAGVAGG
ncbi:DUF5947 family protein [Catellatospora bangladeshensis]|uniref:Uncharacterized protein n=1 Tax=Catellatospora bangladeshensis TaxID=310355 RepID=A0A8J3JVX6_9ACTN|nr:DUF5947 family protein [Catellatospora bangladeshensis]GIF86115.1 hypothetical protein Cba03nite_74640 [Catellatospora bangladeshensis]